MKTNLEKIDWEESLKIIRRRDAELYKEFYGKEL